MSTEQPTIQIQGLKISVHARQDTSATDYWDSNWLLVTVVCASKGAEVRVNGPFIHLSEIDQWANDAEILSTTLNGEANLKCMEPELSVQMKIDKLGNILMTVDITPDSLTQQHRFQFDIDQSFLPKLISECRSLLVTYPILFSEQR